MESTAKGTLGTEAPASPMEQEVYLYSQWQLMWLKFKKHKLAVIGGGVVLLFYLVAVLHPFLAPYNEVDRTDYIYFKPQKMHLTSNGKLTKSMPTTIPPTRSVKTTPSGASHCPNKPCRPKTNSRATPAAVWGITTGRSITACTSLRPRKRRRANR